MKAGWREPIMVLPRRREESVFLCIMAEQRISLSNMQLRVWAFSVIVGLLFGLGRF